jgi:hypothetical protein
MPVWVRLVLTSAKTELHFLSTVRHVPLCPEASRGRVMLQQSYSVQQVDDRSQSLTRWPSYVTTL